MGHMDRDEIRRVIYQTAIELTPVNYRRFNPRRFNEAVEMVYQSFISYRFDATVQDANRYARECAAIYHPRF